MNEIEVTFACFCQTSARILSQIGPQLPPSIFCPIHYSLILTGSYLVTATKIFPVETLKKKNKIFTLLGQKENYLDYL
jgi:hypothetical protein